MRVSCRGFGYPTRFRNARADLGSSAMKWSRALARCSAAAGITASAGVSPRVFGSRYSEPAASEDIEALLAQEVDQRDERKTDERARILALYPGDQRDSQTFGLCAAGAIVRLLLREVALDLSVVQPAKADAAGHDADPRGGGPRIVDADRGVELGFAPRERAKLTRGVVVCAGLAEDLAVAVRDLIAADNEGAREASSHRERLGSREALRHRH